MNAPRRCVKCHGEDVRIVYHAQGCDRASCRCTNCLYSDHAKQHDEHLHAYCQTCRFDWVEQVAVSGAHPASRADQDRVL